jgi:acyl-CoA thioester hydrolase
MRQRRDYKHSIQITVRNYEIDWQGIVHNVTYLLYCEAGRITYLKDLGLPIAKESIQGEMKMVVARNEIDYCSAAHFGDVLNVHTGISSIGNTSFTFEGLIEHAASGEKVAQNVSVHVWLGANSDRPAKVPEKFRALVLEFEGKNVHWSGLREAPPQ